MPAWHFRRRPWYWCIAWDGSWLTVRCSFTEYVTTLSVWQMALIVRQPRRLHSSVFKTLAVGCFNKNVPKRNFASSSLAGQLLCHYLVLFLSVLLTKLHIFCTIMTRNAQNKPRMVTPCLSICFNLDSDERLSVKFCIWSIHLILGLRNFGCIQ